MVNWQEKEKVQCSFEEAIKDLQQKEPPAITIQTPIKANFIKNFSLDTKNEFLNLSNPPNLFVLSILPNISNLLVLPILMVQHDLWGLHDLLFILEQ